MMKRESSLKHCDNGPVGKLNDINFINLLCCTAGGAHDSASRFDVFVRFLHIPFIDQPKDLHDD